MSVENELLKKKAGCKRKSLWVVVAVSVLVLLGILVFFLCRTKQELNDIKKRLKQVKDVFHANNASHVQKFSPVNESFHNGNEPFFNIRLPSIIKPYLYNIFLDVNLENDIVNGHCDIYVNISMPTKYVIVHAFKFDKIKAEISFGDFTFKPKSQFFFEKNQYYVAEFDKLLNTGKYKLNYEFVYKLRDDLQGFYKASYKNSAGVERFAAFTQFAPVEARTAFPCFDEPSMKAQFKITLKHTSELISVANMPLEITKEKNGETINTFKTSSIMSTYLVAFIVCDFKMKTILTGSTEIVKMDFYAPDLQIDQLDFALNVGAKILPFFEAYYNVSYPLPKADMVAVPDFAAGAMENWGLITFRLESLLFNPNESAISNKKYIATTVSHELAHMWFGNIVTMDWWSDLWLNEGFATFVSYLGIKKVFPSWNFTDDQVISDGAVALKLDALESSHPIFVQVNHPDEINEIFDVISYKKGGYILRMLDGFLGNDIFLKGLHKYLHSYSFSNAKTQDLWDALSEAAGGRYNVSQIMDTWTIQMGFPVVTVTSNSDSGFELSQTRFYSAQNPDHRRTNFSSELNYKWMIPFHYTTYKKLPSGWTQIGSMNMTWLEMNDKNLSIQQGLMIKGNSHQNGFYRVNYDRNGWAVMTEILKENHLIFDVKDRAGLISDVFAFADSGLLNYSIALDLFDYIDKENDYLPWAAVEEATLTLRKLMTFNEDIFTRFKKFLLKKTSPLFDKYGFRDVTNFNERNLQVLIVNLACESGHPACLGNASMLFNMWMKNPLNNPISPDFRNTVYYYGVQNGNEREWDFLYEQYLNTNVASESNKFLHGMAASKQLWLIDRYLHKSLDNKIVKDQDFGYVIQYVANNNAVGQYLSLYFIKEHWGFILKKHMKSHFTLKDIFEGIFSGFSTEYELESFQRFVKNMGDLSAARRVIEQLFEKIRANIEWRKHNEKLIYDWLLKKNL